MSGIVAGFLKTLSDHLFNDTARCSDGVTSSINIPGGHSFLWVQSLILLILFAYSTSLALITYSTQANKLHFGLREGKM